MDPKWQFLQMFWQHRAKLLVLVLIVSLIAPQPARAQFGIDWAAIRIMLSNSFTPFVLASAICLRAAANSPLGLPSEGKAVKTRRGRAAV